MHFQKCTNQDYRTELQTLWDLRGSRVAESSFRFVSFADASQSDAGEEWDEGKETRRRTDARVALNLFPRVLRDAAIKREWAEAIYARRDYPTDNWQRPDNRRNFGGSATVYGGQIKFITIDLLNYYRAGERFHRAPK